MRSVRRPREDHGFFGPDSPTWRVWTHPTAVLGFQRTIVVETFDPFLAAEARACHGRAAQGKARDPGRVAPSGTRVARSRM